MSARYSKTCSGGFEIVVEALTGSMPGRIVCPCRLGDFAAIEDADPDRIPELRMVHDPGIDGRSSLQRATELADHTARLVHVHTFADQRCPAAAGACACRRAAG